MTTIGWLDAREYPFCALLEAHYGAILADLERVIHLRVWIPWKERPYTPTTAIPGGIGDGEPHWRLFGLYLRGTPIERHCRLCPDTARVLAQVPKVTKAAFACLEAGAVIQPHMGHNPHNDRTHLGLVIPPGDCGMRVGGDGGPSRGWTAGEATIFRDNQVHEAWNRTASHRYILIVDVDNRGPDAPPAAADSDAF
jgi:ornithine lipid ester-linked acyl 2-hydroxylase